MRLPILQPQVIVDEDAGRKTDTLGVRLSVCLELVAGSLAQVLEPRPPRQLAPPCLSLQGAGRHAIERDLKPMFDALESVAAAKIVVVEATPKKEVERLSRRPLGPGIKRHRAKQPFGSSGEPYAELLLRLDRNVIEFEMTEVTLHRLEDTRPLVTHGADTHAINSGELLNH